jgi:hypothetical protein
MCGFSFSALMSNNIVRTPNNNIRTFNNIIERFNIPPRTPDLSVLTANLEVCGFRA